jgi:hypothetical protein
MTGNVKVGHVNTGAVAGEVGGAQLSTKFPALTVTLIGWSTGALPIVTDTVAAELTVVPSVAVNWKVAGVETEAESVSLIVATHGIGELLIDTDKLASDGLPTNEHPVMALAPAVVGKVYVMVAPTAMLMEAELATGGPDAGGGVDPKLSVAAAGKTGLDPAETSEVVVPAGKYGTVSSGAPPFPPPEPSEFTPVWGGPAFPLASQPVSLQFDVPLPTAPPKMTSLEFPGPVE